MDTYTFEQLKDKSRYIRVEGEHAQLINTTSVNRIHGDESLITLFVSSNDGRFGRVEIEASCPEFIKKYLEFLNGE